MNISKQQSGFSRKVIVLAILAAFGPVHAEDDIAELVKPDSSVSVGVGAVSGNSKDRALFGQYNGLRNHDYYGLFDIDFVRRNDETGTWTTFQGRNLGLDTREVRFGQQKQGDWKYSAEYSELVRNYQNTINTGLIGAGTATPTVVSVATPGAGRDLDLQLKRKMASMSFEKWINSSIQFEANFKNEDKDGARLFGRGLNCSAPRTNGTNPNVSSANPTIPCGALNSGFSSGALLLLPEPIDSTTRQIESKLNFSGEKYLVSAAYYGSFYTNANGSLRPVFGGNLFNPNGSTLSTSAGGGAQLANYMQQPIALPPDNQAHQLSLSGNYAFTPTTHATFKYAYTHATQNEDFASMGLTGGPAGVANLGGEVNTTLMQVGLTMRPISKLSLLANVRYEDRDNKTPVGLYSPPLLANGTATPATTAPVFRTGVTNSQEGLKKLDSKVEASYQLAQGYRGTLGIDYGTVDFGRPESTASVGGLNLLREKTQETAYRAELRRSMSETLTGAIGYVRSNRKGSDWLNAGVQGTPAVTDAAAAALGSGRPVAPTMFMDRTQDKVKLSADWSPVERLSLQFVVEDGKDKYDSPHTGVFKGLGETGSSLYGIDASFALNDNWKLNGYWSQGDQSMNVNHSLYVATLKNKSTNIGLGLTGKVSSKVQVGGNLTYTDDKSSYAQGLEALSNTAAAITTNTTFLTTTGGLPDTSYRATTLKFFGTYALDKNSGMRLDLIHQRAKWNDWGWGYAGVPFFYSDNATVSSNQSQSVSFIGVNYIYRFQ